MILKIAITGGTSSGKSFVSKIFSEQLNCLTFDTDKIVSDIYKDINFCKLHFQNNERFLQLLNKNKVVCKRKLKKAILDNNLILDEICKIVYPELKNQIFKISNNSEITNISSLKYRCYLKAILMNFSILL